MANTIQIKRSSASIAATGLNKGELAWVDHGTGGAAGILYIGDMAATSAVQKIGGPGWALEILTNAALTGVPRAPTAAQSVNDTQLATTAFVQTAVAAGTVAIANASDTDITSPAGGHILIYDGVDTWDNKPISGSDLTIDAAGVAVVTGVAANAVALGTDTTGNYVSSITGTTDEIEVTNGVGSEGAAVIVGLPNNVTITGNLTVSGTTTQVDSTVVTIADPIFSIGQSATDDNKDRGIEFKYNDGSARVGFFGYDEDAAEFTGYTAATATSETYNGTRINANFGDIAGTLTTASQTAITGVGTITTGAWNGTIIDTEFGGTGQDFSASTGVLSVSGGTMSVASEMPVTLGGTGLQAVVAEGMLVGAGTADMTVLAIGSTGQHMSVSSGGSPEWSDSVDGGTF